GSCCPPSPSQRVRRDAFDAEEVAVGGGPAGGDRLDGFRGLGSPEPVRARRRRLSPANSRYKTLDGIVETAVFPGQKLISHTAFGPVQTSA
ncbi:MAG: hypothetical protein OXF41_03740, partial [bacterium]|nr:hypothetical protein [bacterium]